MAFAEVLRATVAMEDGGAGVGAQCLDKSDVGSPSRGGVVHFAGPITGTASSQFIAQNDAVARVSGSGNTYTAGTVGAESNGSFQCDVASCFGDNANDIYMGGGLVFINTSATFSNDFVTSTSTPNVSELNTTQNVSITGTGTVNDDLVASQSGSASTLQFTGAITLNGNLVTGVEHQDSFVKFDGVISGGGDITSYQGNAFLSAANTFTGDVTVNDEATVYVDQLSSLGSTAGSTTVADGGSLVIAADMSGSLAAEPITLSGEGNMAYQGAIYNQRTTGDTVIPGTITLVGDVTVNNPVTGTGVELSGVIGGTGDLTLTSQWDSLDSASIEITGAAPNTYSGDTKVTGGVAYFQKTGAIPGDLHIDNANPGTNRAHAYFYDSSNVIADTGVVTLGSDENNHLTFGEDNEVIGGLQGTNGTVQVQTSGDTVVIDQDFDSTYDGVFYTDGNAATIQKRGTGILTLNGSYGFIGDDITFDVVEGTLVANGNLQTTNGGDVTLNGGTLKGRGTVNAVNALSGTLAPGNSPGKLTVTDLTLNSGSTFEAELAGAVAGTSYDQVAASGSVNLGGATLEVLPTYTPASGQVFTIITAASVTGTFNGLANGATVTVSGVTLRVNYTATAVTLTYVSGEVIPGTPSTGLPRIAPMLPLLPLLVAGMGAVGLAGYRYRSRLFAGFRR